MWIASSNISSTSYNYLANKPIKKDFKLNTKDLVIIALNSLTFVEDYDLIKLTFNSLFKISNFQNSASISFTNLNIDINIVYLDNGTDLYFYSPALFSFIQGNNFLQEENFYDSDDLSPVYIFRPSNISSSIYGNVRYKISNIQNRKELDIFFTNPTYIFNLYISIDNGESLQLITKEFLDSYPFEPSTTIYIEYRYKFYDVSNPNLTMFNKNIVPEVVKCKFYAHGLENPYDVDILADNEKSYRPLLRYTDLVNKGFIVTDNHLIKVR